MVGDSGIGVFLVEGVTVESGPNHSLYGRLKHSSNLMKFLAVFFAYDNSYMPEMAGESLAVNGTNLSDEINDFYTSQEGSTWGCELKFAQFEGETGQLVDANAGLASGSHGYYSGAGVSLFRTNFSFNSVTPIDVKDFKTGTMETATHTVESNGFFILFTFDYYGFTSGFAECTINGNRVPFQQRRPLSLIAVYAYTGDVIRVKMEMPYHGCSYGILKVE